MDSFLTFPNIDPIALSLGPLVIRWYALAYLAGLLIGWRYCVRLAARMPWKNVTEKHLDDLLLWVMIGVILGGRVGYVIFYQSAHYLDNPLDIFKVWNGGMSFHGGFLGVLVASYAYAVKHKIAFFDITDILACATPIGLFFGRVANFINGELYGRPSEFFLAMVFPNSDGLPRHPSQLYEAFLEGICLFLILYFASKKFELTKCGMLSGLFLIGYGSFRFVVEFVREPDAQLGFVVSSLSMGQLLCLPMILAGFIIIAWSRTKHRDSIDDE